MMWRAGPKLLWCWVATLHRRFHRLYRQNNYPENVTEPVSQVRLLSPSLKLLRGIDREPRKHPEEGDCAAEAQAKPPNLRVRQSTA